LLAICSGLYAALRLFSGFSFYDDEGSLILMSRWLLEGHSVYGEFNSIYGPFYFLYQWIAHTLLGGVTSHSTARLIAVAPWVLTSVMAFTYSLSATRSYAAAMVTWLAVLRTLAFMEAEPGHPQEICVLLLAGLILAMRWPSSRRLALGGAILAALTLTKINLGVFAAGGLVLALASELRTVRVRGPILELVGAVCVAAPVLLMWPSLGDAWVRGCCALITLSILLVVAVMTSQTSPGDLVWRHCIWLAAGFVACAIVVLLWSLGHGGSLGVMVRSTLVDNLKEAHSWSVPLTLGPTSALAAAVSASAALLWLAGIRGRAFEWLQLGAGGWTLLLIIANRPEDALGIGLPFVWMVLPRRRQAYSSPHWQRNLLAAMTVVQALSVYPVAGSQVRFSLVLLAISAGWMVHAAWTSLAKEQIWPAGVARRAGQWAIAVALAGYLFFAARALNNYMRLPPLQLPGTYGVHIEQDDRATYHWVVANTRDNSCDSLVSFPAMHSVYLWTGMVPPVYPDVDGWQAYENTARQAVERRLLSSPRACVLYIDKLMKFLIPHAEADQSTLLGFIRGNFVEIAERNGFHLLMRKKVALESGINTAASGTPVF
jgi:hypothetical protein